MVCLILSLGFALIIQAIIINISSTRAYDFLYNCTGSPTYAPNSLYKTNLYLLLSNLTTQSSYNGFYVNSLGHGSDTVYGMYLCRGDMDSRGCNDCVYQARANLTLSCPSQIYGIIWYDNCMLRFTNVSIFSRLVWTPGTFAYNGRNISDQESRDIVDAVNNNLTDFATQVANSTIKYATRETTFAKSQMLYTLGQCTPDLTPKDCVECLRISISELPHKVAGRILKPSCNVRFEIIPFYNEFTNVSFFLPPTTNSFAIPKGKRSSHVAVAVSIPVVIAALLAVAALCGLCHIQNQKNTKPSPELDGISSVESLQFPFKEIRVATNNFSLDNKLGEGGFGVVYKGMLKDGQEIAVKRLSVGSSQGIKEFKTEVVLVAKLQHKNLVKLLGFCIRAKEKLLVYELLPNSSLDKVLGETNNQQSLGWETRYKIIAGIARGLLYLHEDSRLKIIHRDLKSSNILLDKGMEPKIADFGLARLVGTTQIQADTNRIVGTYGYMAPEYAMNGRFSVKSDAYSFGVIVLEIISGHKCSSTTFPFDEESLPQRAWSLWSTNVPTQLVDSRLGDNFSSEEAEICFHIALLCIQEDASKRPTMAPIVSALSGHPVNFPMPAPPHLVTNGNTFTQNSSAFSGTNDLTEVCPR